MQSNEIKIIACAPPACKCPVLEFNLKNNPFVVIYDDYNKCITIKPEEMDVLAKEWISKRNG